MSGRLVGEVFKYAPADLTSSQLLVLLALAESARDTDRIARYSTANTIADTTHLSYGTVKNALSELVSRGLIIRIGKAHRGRAQNYRLAQLHAHHTAATVHYLPRPPDPDGDPDSDNRTAPATTR